MADETVTQTVPATVQDRIDSALRVNDYGTAQALSEAPTGNLPAVAREADPPAVPESVTLRGDLTSLSFSPGTVAISKDHMAAIFAAAADWDQDYAKTLWAKWGSDVRPNLAFARAFLETHPEILDALSITPGNGEYCDHPRLIEVGAILGRLYASTPGNPATVKDGREVRTAPSPETRDGLTAEISGLNAKIDAALSRCDLDEAQRLSDLQVQLLAKRDGNRPAVGRGGRWA